MTDPFALRPVAPGDEPFLFAVYASTRTEELAPVPWSEEEKQAFLRQQFAAQHRYYTEQFPGCSFDVILRAGQPAGRLYVDRREREISIIDIALLPEHRRAGIGSALLQTILEEADRDRKPVVIHVEHFNPALRLYERLGFRKVDDSGVYFLMERPPAPS